ncbi:ABC transporter ATP-binding protein [Exiguobacterium sp. U13-1]|uniref:ATP-binding cassette domain-containing protein n=1 Tax=Exiguobacterium TaxID=33986 RepID=UPI000451906D|nr:MULTISPECIES: ATP-binding cassette domain-containing protein [Exiguobacterium]AOT01771.1 ABC transporter ATP-binding protein [Exiguobacterium sp. U13-1]EZP59679.1 ABC transporter family protein [Exiguobacterium sp. RIT341]KNH34748.1 ABC transporter ATP-binding protein [Exiguobacterium acetylicum]
MMSINVNNVSFGYGNQEILNDFSLEIQKPGIYSLFGKSGCGKTTLINILSLIQAPTHGEVVLFNQTLDFSNKEKIDEARKQIAYFFQDLNLIEALTVRENLEIISLINHQNIDEERLKRYSEKIGMSKKLDVPVNNLSGGERQRAAFLKVMIFEYKLILLDEPTNNLDKENIEMIMDLLKEIKSDKIILIVTHSNYVVGQSDQTFNFNELNRGIAV